MAATCAISLEYSRNTDLNYGNVLWPTEKDEFQLSKVSAVLTDFLYNSLTKSQKIHFLYFDHYKIFIIKSS